MMVGRLAYVMEFYASGMKLQSGIACNSLLRGIAVMGQIRWK